MFSKDVQKVVLSKYENGNNVRKIFRDLNRCVGLRTIERWLKQIRAIGTIDTSKPPGPSCTIRTKATIEKVRRRFSKGKKISERILARELKTSKTSIRRLLREDLSYRPYKIIKQRALTNEQKINRKRFAKWVQNNFRKDDIRKWLFSDEKVFDIDAVYNSQNDRIWAPSRAEANKQGGRRRNVNFQPG